MYIACVVCEHDKWKWKKWNDNSIREMTTAVIMHIIWSNYRQNICVCFPVVFSELCSTPWSHSQVEIAAQLSDHVIGLSFLISVFVLISFFSITASEETWPSAILRAARYSILGLFFLYTKKLAAILFVSSVKGRVSLKSEWMNEQTGFLFLWHFRATL